MKIHPFNDPDMIFYHIDINEGVAMHFIYTYIIMKPTFLFYKYQNSHWRVNIFKTKLFYSL